MSELILLKQKIYQDKKIEEILMKLGCQNISTEQKGDLYTASLPEGTNTRSVQVRNNEFLNSHIRSKGVKGDIYTLVSYIEFGAITDEERKQSLYEAKSWLLEQLGYFYLSDIKPTKKKWNSWLHDVRKKRKNKINLDDLEPNRTLDKSILKQYHMYPIKEWIDEGLLYETQKEFKVGFDLYSERIIFPVYNNNGNLIGIKGRYIGKGLETLDKQKYLYLYKLNKSIELFNFHKALPCIEEKKEVYIVEGAKTTMFAWQYGYKNFVSIEGDHLTSIQIRLLKSLGIDITYIFAWDKDKDVDFIKEQLVNMGKRKTYFIYDKDNLLKEKDSITDRGHEIFKKLIINYKYKIK